MKHLIYLAILFMSLNASAQVNDDWANLKRYAEANKALKPLQKGEKRVVFMGNSITESWSKIDSNFFFNNNYINRGISGQTTPQMLLRFRQDVIALNPSCVVILAGVNDIAQNTGPIAVEDIFGNIVSMVQLAKANKIKVVLCSVLPVYDFHWRRGLLPAPKISQLNTLLKSYAKEHKIPYVDYYSAMVDERKGLDKEYTNDGVHPTLAGYKVMEPLVQVCINRALKK